MILTMRRRFFDAATRPNKRVVAIKTLEGVHIGVGALTETLHGRVRGFLTAVIRLST